MNNPAPGHFDIFDAIGRAYVFAWYQRGFLLQKAIWPSVVIYLTGLVSLYFNTTFLPLRGFLIHIPQSCFLGWYFFVIARFALLGEQNHTFKNDTPARQQDLRLTIVILLLFNGIVSALTAFLLYSDQNPTLAGLMQLLSLPLLVLLIWSVRYFILYVPAAIGFDLRRFLHIDRGFGVSVRFALLILFASLPVLLSAYAVLSLTHYILPAPAQFSLDVTTLLHLAIATVISVAMFVIVHLSVVFAVGQILKRHQDGGSKS